MESLDVRVEPYFEWVVEKSQMVSPVPEIKGIHYVPDLGPYIERKLFTVNTGHAATAYLGFRKNLSTVDEALRDASIKKTVEDALSETSKLLEIKHGFDAQELEAYRNKIIGRFENPYITDEIMRVARSPQRKLGPNDRLTGPATQLAEHGVEPKALVKVIAAALHFMNQNDSEAEEMHAVIEKEGIEKAITIFTGIEASNPLHEAIVQAYHAD
jgi:mannitol-1-phosphate 5-dehydrogenase